MTTLVAPYQFNVPQAPQDLYLQKLDDFGITRHQDDNVDYYLTSLQGDASDDVKTIRLVKTAESIRRGKANRSGAGVEIADEKQWAGGKR